MPVDWHSAGITYERKNEKTRQGKLLRITELRQTDHHINVTLVGLIFICAQKSIPPG